MRINRPWPRFVATGVVVGSLAGLVTLPASAAPTGDWPTWTAEATGEFRTGRTSAGEYVWSNGVYQSRGANTDGLHHEEYWGQLATGGELPIEERDDVDNHLTWGAFGVDRWATDGDQEWPLDDAGWPEYTGEINEFRIAVDDDEVFLRWRFTSMPDADTQIATLVIDAGGAAAAEAWPHGSGVTSPWDVAVTAWGTGGTLTTAGGEPVALADVGGAVRTDDHGIEVRLPRTALPSGEWRLGGGGGLTDPADRTQYWAVPAGSATDTSPGSGSTLAAGSPVWSLLFATEEAWVFTARAEGDLLVGGDVSEASVTIDVADLDLGGTVEPTPTSGRLARQYDSAYDFGDGITKGTPDELPGFLMIPPEVPLDDAARSFEYTGGVQPYGMYVPAAYHERTEPWPLIVYLHGLNNYYYEPFGLVQGLDEAMDEGGYLFAGLLGRGDLSYLGRGELDVREAIADIAANYDVDPDRIHLMGHSMGSIGTHNVVTRNPDRFASASPAEITASDELLVNLMHVPWMTAGGIEDPLDPNAQSELDTYETMSALGYDTRTYLFQLKTHENSSIYDNLPQTIELYDRTRRVTAPGTFTYRRLPGDDYPDLGIVHDRAYAATNLTFADDAAPQQIDVTSYAIPHSPLDPDAATRTDEQVDEGGRSGRTAAQKLVTVPAFGPPHDVRNAGDVTLDNVSEVTLDLATLALQPIVNMTVNVTTTTDTVLRLTTTTRAVGTPTLDGATVTGAIADGEITVPVPAGDHTFVLAAAAPATTPPPAAPATPPSAPAPSNTVTPPAPTNPLPTTGGGAILAAITLLTGAAATRRRRP